MGASPSGAAADDLPSSDNDIDAIFGSETDDGVEVVGTAGSTTAIPAVAKSGVVVAKTPFKSSGPPPPTPVKHHGSQALFQMHSEPTDVWVASHIAVAETCGVVVRGRSMKSNR